MLTGTVSRPTVIQIPVVNLKRYFNNQLTKSLENRNIYFKDSFQITRKNNNDILIFETTHNISQAIEDILKNSNNLASETLFKLAGAKYSNLISGTDASGIKMFNDYCSKNKIDNSRIRITDASGVSKNNLVSADFVSEFLKINKDNVVLKSLPSPGEGTLTHRLLPIKQNLKAKTGTLSDISSIAGFLTTKQGENLVFCIIINDAKLSIYDKKNLEDYIIREAFLRL
jgi:D-alanyl-D-alanine carboxypeptidase/D-alanyl-D-alanine-endopeptidase (penicillin-binding protein 4)